MIDRLRQMAIFAKTIDHGSFRGVAGELRLSPSVVSHHIAQLEEHLGVALIYRTTRKLTLTREGERLLAATRKMLEAVEGELLALSGSANTPSGDLRITLPSVLSQSIFTDKIVEFTKLYPRINLTLDFSDTRRKLVDDGFDIAVRMGPSAKNSSTSRKLFTVRRKLVASVQYLKGRPGITEPKQLLDLDWITLAPAQNVPTTFRKRGRKEVTIKPVARIFSNDAQGLYRLSRAGAGLALVPDFLAEEDITSGVMTHLLPDWRSQSLDVSAIWHANAPKHGLIHLALDALSQKTT